MQGLGWNQKASKMKAWLQFHLSRRELANKERNSIIQTANKKLIGVRWFVKRVEAETKGSINSIKEEAYSCCFQV